MVKTGDSFPFRCNMIDLLMESARLGHQGCREATRKDLEVLYVTLST